jgi:hypothetical protein
VSRHKTAERDARERAAASFDAEAVAKSKAATAQLRAHQDTLNEFERLYQVAMQEAIHADEVATRVHPDVKLRNARRRIASAAHAEVDRIQDNLKFYRLTWLGTK